MRHLPLALLATLLLWAPLPFGSVTPLGVLVVVAWVAALALAAALATDGAPAEGTGGALAALFGLGLLGFVQSLPGLGRWLPFLGPEPVGGLPGELGSHVGGSLSLAPALSRQAAVGWWTVALLLLAAMLVARKPPARPVLLGAVVLAAAFQGLYGWRRLSPWSAEIWGREVSGPPRLRGTLVNSDHLATLFEIVMAISLAWTWWAWRRSRREPRFTRRMAWLLPPIAAWAGCGVGLVATGSRAALAAVMLGAVAQAALIFLPRGRWWVPAGLLVAVVLAGSMVVSRGPTETLGRQLSRPLYEVVRSERFAVWGPALDLWRTAPWIGTGLGTFEEGFPRVQPYELREDRWGRAHNDPLELLVTGGVVGVALLAWALWVLVRRLWRVYRSQARGAVRASALAALAALPPVLLHECVDFGLTIPANAVLLTALLGFGAAGPIPGEAGAAPRRRA